MSSTPAWQYPEAFPFCIGDASSSFPYTVVEDISKTTAMKLFWLIEDIQCQCSWSGTGESGGYDVTVSIDQTADANESPADRCCASGVTDQADEWNVIAAYATGSAGTYVNPGDEEDAKEFGYDLGYTWPITDIGTSGNAPVIEVSANTYDFQFLPLVDLSGVSSEAIITFDLGGFGIAYYIGFKATPYSGSWTQIASTTFGIEGTTFTVYLYSIDNTATAPDFAFSLTPSYHTVS